jgi:RNA polymerase sigma factor (sigma-70 family)
MEATRVLECGRQGVPAVSFFMCSKPAAPFRRLVIGMSMATRVSELGNGVARVGVGTYADLDDRMLVLDFQAGNEGAFSEIHRRYSGLARHVCQRILRNAEDADEATQEAMLRVYQGLQRFNGRYALQPWVARIATNVSLDVTRARARRPRESDRAISELHELLHEPSDDPLEQVERLLERERINEILDLIPEHHRDALVLREVEGRSHKEIGEVLGVTPSQAKALIHRAKGSFRRAWDGVKERRGLGVLVPFFTAPFRGRGFLGRLLQPATELAAASTAAPAVTAPLVTTGERVTAAALAVIVAGSAAVGAVTLKHQPHKVKPVSTPSVAVVAAASPSPKSSVDRVRKETPNKAKLIPAIVASPSVILSPSPSLSPSPILSPSPSPSPSPSESPSPPASSTPTIGPAPPWSLAFSSSVPIRNWKPELDSVSIDGTAGGKLDFSETVSGPAVSSKNPDGRLSVGFSGSAHGASGKVTLWIILDTVEGRFVYSAPGMLTNVMEADGSLVDYTFTGNYYAVGWPSADDGSPLGVTGDVPHDGTFQLDLRFWGDGTSLYEVGLALQESGL